LTKDEGIGNRKVRKEREAQRLASVSAEAQTIKYADIIDNLSDTRALDAKFLAKYRKEKRRQLMLMCDGYQALRQQAWLLTY
jgi:hypothetical protein